MSGRALLAAPVAALALAAFAPAAVGTVPPKNCGRISVDGRNYQIKADQIRCRTAKEHSRRYLDSGRRPSGYSCNRPSGTKLAFRCRKGVRQFFAIRR